MEYWEIMLILRGYRRRNVLHYQLQRINAFSSTFCFRANEKNITVEEFFPMYFDEKDVEMSDDEIAEERARIAAENERIAKGEA